METLRGVTKMKNKRRNKFIAICLAILIIPTLAPLSIFAGNDNGNNGNDTLDYSIYNNIDF
jgi:hypothetical protein